MEITAAIARLPGQDFSLETCTLAAPGPGEVLVKVDACGVCHTDVAARDQDMPVPLPAVLGHEGVGRILQLGDGVTDFSVGDRVLMSFGSCGTCGNCRDHAPAYCDHGLMYQVMGMRANGSSPISQNGQPLTGHFFAQSSFATHAVASTHNMVKLDDDLPQELMAPLACGVQTGMASVMLAMDAKAGKAIVVAGCGTVGLAAVMAAKIVGCDPIIAVDIKDSRLALARELGATHCINGATGSLVEALAALGGADYALDSTGVPAVASAVFDALKPRGTLLCVGVGKPGAQLSIDMGMLMATGRTVRGAIEGDAVPRAFIPEMITLYRQGRLPLEKLVRTYRFEDINRAVDDALSGAAVKPVLLM